MPMLLRSLILGTVAATFLVPSVPDPSVGVWILVPGSGTGEPPLKLAVHREGADGWILVSASFASRVETVRMKRDGQDYPVRGAVAYQSVSSVRLDARVLEAVFRKDRRELRRCTWEFAAAGDSSKLCCTDGTAANYKRRSCPLSPARTVQPRTVGHR